MPIRVDRKSGSHSQPRLFAAVATIGLAALTLMLGADATLGLDVPTAGGAGATHVTQNVSSTVQGATQQVASTVDTTVQTTQQVASQVQPTAAPVAAAPAPVTAPAPVAAPKAHSAPAKSTAVHAVAAPVRKLAAKAGGASSASATTTGAATVREVRDTTTRSLRSATTRRTRTSTRGRPAPNREASSDCGANDIVSTVGPILSALSQDSLLAFLCDATGMLSTGKSASASASPAGTNRLIGVVAAVPAHLKVLGLLINGHESTIATRKADGSAGRGARVAAAAHAATSGTKTSSAGAVDSSSAAASANLAAATSSAQAVEAQTHHGGGLFGSSVTGTEAVFALLVADWALLVGIVMWKLARRRRYVPIFS